MSKPFVQGHARRPTPGAAVHAALGAWSTGLPAEQTVALLPGEHFAGDERFRVKTLLGSCVSIVLWQPQRRLGAMSHFVLAGGRAQAQRALDGRYARDALRLMLTDLRERGVAPGDCVAKVFGGGAMFDAHTRLPDVGRMNGEAARTLLQAHGIPIVSESLFGGGHRQIIFSVRSGEVWMRHVAPTGGKAAA